MEKITRSELDTAAASLLDAQIKNRNLSNKNVETLTHGAVGYNRVRDLRMGLRGPMRLSEFVDLCRGLDLDPLATLSDILVETAANERTTEN
ncbi:MAG: hypothetical protein PUF51_04815 [Bifidobacteriaceae bacterium]|nr:hypothetical protein [Bifidobacteriaceae bacterium]